MAPIEGPFTWIRNEFQQTPLERTEFDIKRVTDEIKSSELKLQNVKESFEKKRLEETINDLKKQYKY